MAEEGLREVTGDGPQLVEPAPGAPPVLVLSLPFFSLSPTLQSSSPHPPLFLSYSSDCDENPDLTIRPGLDASGWVKQHILVWPLGRSRGKTY